MIMHTAPGTTGSNELMGLVLNLRIDRPEFASLFSDDYTIGMDAY